MLFFVLMKNKYYKLMVQVAIRYVVNILTPWRGGYWGLTQRYISLLFSSLFVSKFVKLYIKYYRDCCQCFGCLCGKMLLSSLQFLFHLFLLLHMDAWTIFFRVIVFLYFHLVQMQVRIGSPVAGAKHSAIRSSVPVFLPCASVIQISVEPAGLVRAATICYI